MAMELNLTSSLNFELFVHINTILSGFSISSILKSMVMLKGRCLFEFFLLKKACPVYSRFTFSFRFFLCSLNLIMFVYFWPRDAEKLESHTIPLCLHEYNDSLLNPTTIKRLEYLVNFSDHFSKSI